MSTADPEITLRYANSVEEIDVVEPMRNALQEHRVQVTPELDPQTPIVSMSVRASARPLWSTTAGPTGPDSRFPVRLLYPWRT
jgi:hypothetical protein